jgi:hypothetical protein
LLDQLEHPVQKRTVVFVALLVTFGFTATTALPAEASNPTLHFSYALPNSPGSDNGSNPSLNAEWVRVSDSSSTRTYTLTGYTIRDRSSHVYTFGTFRLKPRASVTLHTGSGRNTSTDRYWGKRWYVWNNSGDEAFLKDNHRLTKDICIWGRVANGIRMTC